MGQIDLPARLNFNTSAHNMAFQNALQKIVYPQNIPSAYRYPKAPYGVAGLGAHGDFPPPPYCTDFADYASMLQYFGVELCNQSTPGDQYACSLRNAPKLIQVANFQNDCTFPTAYQSGTTPVNPANPYVPPTGTGTQIPVGTGTPATSGGGSLIWSPSRQGGTLQPGDTYTIRVLGPPNTPVTVNVTHNGSTTTGNPMGNTGADGSFSITGGIDSSELGSWSESWYIGGVLAGLIAFNVAAVGTGTGVPVSPSVGGSMGYSPVVSFLPSRQGMLEVGDTWVIRITGGAPNSIVSVYGGQNGVSTTNQMGVTDQNGNFQVSGTIDSSSIGNWSETWYVGSQNAGSFSFSVASPSSDSTPPPSGGALPGGSAPPLSPATPSSTWIPGVSNTVVLAGGGLLALLVLMGGRR